MALAQLIKKYALQNAVKFSGKASVGAVLGKIIKEKPELKKDIRKLMKQIQPVVKKVNALSLEKQRSQLEKIAPELLEKEKVAKKRELPELKKVKGKVVMRFEPSASGPMHIGHAYAISLSSEYCRKYKGKLILRIADTNPKNIYPPAYDMLPEEAQWVTKGNVTQVMVQSDRLETYYQYAEKVIKLGKAYVCTCAAAVFKKLRDKHTACPCRELPVKEHIQRWKKMFTAFKPGDAVLRIKTDLNHKNPALRDWPALRINTEKHPRQGKKRRVWPLMNFSVAVDDMESGMTHIIRAKDHADNAKKQEYLYRYLNRPFPESKFLGKINFVGLQMSTTATRQKIEDGKFSGWDDIRLPFLAALRRRGYYPDAFIKYAISVGVSKNDKTVSGEDFFKSINAFNKELLEKEANRYFFVEHPKKIKIKDAPAQTVKVNLHPDDPKRGVRTFQTGTDFYISKHDLDALKQRKLYRLMNCLNFRKTQKGLVFDSQDYAKYKKEGERIMHWLPVDKNYIHVEVVMPDGAVVKGIGEQAMKKLKEGDRVQLERFGFCRVDKLKNNHIILWFTQS